MNLFILICSILAYENEAARILGVFPTPSISHQVVFRPYTLELAKRGHELVVLTPDPLFKESQAPENYTEIDVHDISYDMWKKGFITKSKGRAENIYEQVGTIFSLVRKVFGKQMQTEQFQAVLKHKQFDLVIVEAMVRPARILSHIFNAPAIILSSTGGFEDIHDLVGATGHPFIYPVLTRQKHHNLTIWEKISELYSHYAIDRIWTKLRNEDDDFVASVFGPNLPKLDDIMDNVQLVLLNALHVWENNRPVPPNLIYVGGIHQKPQKELPKDLKTYLDSSKLGVIYISFGTNVLPSLLPPETIQTMIKVFSQLPYDVLWKWDKDELPGKSRNIRISKWLPQSDLLRHSKLKLFITQGGLQSTEEAMIAGVPLIGMPMLGDQWYNVEQYLRYKIGLRLDMEKLTEENFKNTVEEVIDSESYRQNIARLRDQVYDQPQTPLERAVWWTEHVLRHGGAKHLKAAGANLSWSQFLELELVLVLLSIFLGFITLFMFLVRYLWRVVCSNSRSKLKKS